MKDSADIRKLNKNKIRKILWGGGQYTKQQISADTGLSVATCNTLLNEMELAKEVIGEKKRLCDVGRESVCYQVNEEYETILCISFEKITDKKFLNMALLSPVGRILEQRSLCYDILNYSVISENISDISTQYTNISQIMVGTPSIAEFGTIRHCDIVELENEKIVQNLTEKFHIPVHLENDMHFKAYGYYKKCNKQEEVITLANFPLHVLPGTVSVHAGTVLKGKNQFAGMVGFLPYGIERQEEMALLEKETCRPLVSKAIASIIAIVNPGVIVFTGELLNEDSLEWIRRDCLDSIPMEYIPDFIYEDNFNSFYLEGMYQKALELKGAEK